MDNNDLGNTIAGNTITQDALFNKHYNDFFQIGETEIERYVSTKTKVSILDELNRFKANPVIWKYSHEPSKELTDSKGSDKDSHEEEWPIE